MPALDLNPKVVTHGIEIPAREVREKFARKPHGTDARTLQQQTTRTLDLRRHEGPVEPRIVRDKDASLERDQQAIDDFIERRRVADHPGIDASETGDELRDGDARIDERMKRDGPIEPGPRQSP